MLILFKKFYNFIISSLDSFSALFDHVEKVQVLSSFDLFLHIVWIVFVMLVVGFILGILYKFKIVFYLLFGLGWLIYKFLSFFKKSDQKGRYIYVHRKPVFYQKPFYQKKTSNGKLPYAQYKELEKYVLKKHGVNSFKGGKRK